MPMKIKRCQHCGQDGPHPDAHLWPKALNLDWDTTQKVYPSIDIASYPKKIPNGLYDSNLWCLDCETASQSIDGRVIPELRDFRRHSTETEFGTGRTFARHLQGIEPLALYHFVLSILWRFSASKLQFADRFSLGRLQDRVAEIIRGGDWRTDARKPLGVFVCYIEEDEFRGLVMPPTEFEFQGCRSVHFVGAGLQFIVRTDWRCWPDLIEAFRLAPDQPIWLTPTSFRRNGVMQGLIEVRQHHGTKRNRSV